MRDAEIALISTIGVAAIAGLGLIKYSGSKNSAGQASNDNLKLEVQELTVDNGDKKTTIKGLSIVITEFDKKQNNNQTIKTSVGDKDVSLAMLGKNPINNSSNLEDNTNPIKLDSDLNPISRNNQGPQDTTLVNDNAKYVYALINTLTQIITSAYDNKNITGHDDVNTPLLQHQDVDLSGNESKVGGGENNV